MAFLTATGIDGASSSTSRWIYDVFLSFRGEDTRNNLVSHLYTALVQRGIHTFKDDEELEGGESISPQLLKTIEESRFAIIVFSKNYASSSWCLDELVKIIECENQMGQTVYPIFYDIDPSDVRKQSGSFAEAFAKHELVFMDEKEKVQTWRKALTEAANRSGCDIRKTANGNESKCIQQIVAYIFNKLNSTCSNVAEDLIGIDSRVEKVDSLLGTGSGDVRMIGIWGMGGIGKTTVAQAVYNKISHQFEGASFLSNVREVSEKDGLEALQKRLLSDILIQDLNISRVEKGISIIKARLRYKKVLIILDDVNQVDQLQALAGKHDWFGSGSRIIITTRDERLLTEHEVKERYEVIKFQTKEAIQIFSQKAFKQSYPFKGFEELSMRVIYYAHGLPLALKVLGSSLFGRNINEWESTLSKLQQSPNKLIFQVLQISYDGLENTEKDIFLDIACFFVGKKRDFVTSILDSCGFSPVVGISVLIEKSLITLQSDNRVRMHDLLQEMARHIVFQESPKEPANRSRLWGPEDICQVLEENKVEKKVEGITLDMPKPKAININPKALTEMKRLRLLKIHNAQFSRDLEHLPNELRWLDWLGYPSKSLPTSFSAEKLVALEMCYSRMILLWKGVKLLDNLKFIELSHSQKLTRTPDFTGVPNLERLILEDCTSLVEVHPSIGVLKRLGLLSLKGCKKLKSLPTGLQMESLEILILSGCVELEKFPESLENMECLSELYLDGTAIKDLPASIEHLTGLVLINLSDCKNLTSLPSSICSLRGLKTLTLSRCSNLVTLSENLGNIVSLEELYVNETAIRQTPSSLVLLKNLRVLSFQGCKGKTSRSCTSLFSPWPLPRKSQDSISFVLPSLIGLCSLVRLDVSDCNLVDGSIPSDLGCLSSLEDLNLSRNNFVNLPKNMSQLPRLKYLQLIGCKNLKKIPKLPLSLFSLTADDCISLKSFPDTFTEHKILRHVSFVNCFELVADEQSENMTNYFLQCQLKVLYARLFQGRYNWYLDYNILFSAMKIPEWFSYQSTGSSIYVKLPPCWYNDKFVGFAVCFVAKGITDTSRFSMAQRYWTGASWRTIPCLSMLMQVISKDHREKSVCKCIETRCREKLDSDHVYLHFKSFLSVWYGLGSYEIADSPNDLCEIRFGKVFGVPMPHRWGVRLVYEDDFEQKVETNVLLPPESPTFEKQSCYSHIKFT